MGTRPFEKLIDGDEQAVTTGETTMSTGAIVGVVVAILFLVAVLVVAMLLKSRRQKRRAASKQTISDPTSGTIGVLVHGSTSTPTSAASPPQLTGTLHMRSSTSGMYKKIKMTIEGDTLRYADFKSNKYSVLHGSNVEQLEVVAPTASVSARALSLRIGSRVSSSGSSRYRRSRFPLARVTRPLPQPQRRRCTGFRGALLPTRSSFSFGEVSSQKKKRK